MGNLSKVEYQSVVLSFIKGIQKVMVDWLFHLLKSPALFQEG